MKIFVVACTVFLTLVNVNKSDGQESLPPNFLNIIVILDTSDRVSRERHPRQIKRDIEIVAKIVTQFEKVVREHIDQSEELAYEDSLTVVVPNQPTVPSIPWEISEHLTIEDPRTPTTTGPGDLRNALKKQKEALLGKDIGTSNDGEDVDEASSGKIHDLYKCVEQHEQTGSDIWSWFKYEAVDYFSSDHQNLIICLSDGYLNFDWNIEARRLPGTFMRVRELRDDPNWQQRIHGGEGLSPIGKDFSPLNVKFLMGEITLQGDSSGIPYQQDFDIIKEFWKTWLNSMGIQDIDFRKRLSLQRIKSFISSESR